MLNDRSDRLTRAISYADQLAACEIIKSGLEHIADPVVITDARLDRPGPTITFVNAAFERLSGYDRNELVGRCPRLMQGFDTDIVELARMREALESGRCFEGAVLNYNKSGLEYVVGWAISPVRSANGHVEQWVSVQNDLLADSRAASLSSRLNG